MWLDLHHPLRADLLQPGHAVGLGLLAEGLQRGQLRRVQRDNELAAAVVGDAALVGIAHQRFLSLAGQTRLERPWCVVQPGVQDPAVVAGLMDRQSILALEDRDPQVRPPAEEFASDRQAQDPAADDRHVDAGWQIRGSLVPCGCEGGGSFRHGPIIVYPPLTVELGLRWLAARLPSSRDS